MTDAYAPTTDPVQEALTRLVAMACEDAIFGLSAATGSPGDDLEELVKRRKDAHRLALNGQRTPRMLESFDAWVVEMARATAPICPPAWLPMSEVLGEKVTLEVGARGLRSLFSSKPSDKDVQRVKRLGTLAVRALRTVLAADGPIDAEEARTTAALVASLGLPEADAAPLYTEAPIPVAQLDVYGEIEAGVARAVLRGAWLAAAWDGFDPREEQVVRALATKLSVAVADVEIMRNEAIARVDSRRAAGLATVEAIRWVLADRMPGYAVQLAGYAGALVIPRRYREEPLQQIGTAPVVLQQRHKGLTSAEKSSVLGIAWAAALMEDPSVSRQAIVRSRLDRFAQDLSADPQEARRAVDHMLAMCLAEPSAAAVK